jgi:hypothetical protein
MCINLNIKKRVLLKAVHLISYEALRRNPLHQHVKPIKRCKPAKQENDTIKSKEQVRSKKSGYQAPVSGSPTTLSIYN